MRLRAGLARYHLAREDLGRAREEAESSLSLATKPKARKHMARAHGLLGRIALLEERPEVARESFQAGLLAISEHACPIVAWRLHAGAARSAALCSQPDLADTSRRLAKHTIDSLATNISDEPSRRGFLGSRDVLAIDP